MNNLLIFDGVCKLCAASVQFILRHESGDEIRFAPSQSTTGSRLMRELGIDPGDAETFVFISDGEVLTRSDAALAIAGHFRGGWRVLRLFRFVPRPFRDWAYQCIAKNRYRWFGKREVCMVPPQEMSSRFIDD